MILVAIRARLLLLKLLSLALEQALRVVSLARWNTGLSYVELWVSLLLWFGVGMLGDLGWASPVDAARKFSAKTPGAPSLF